jgi:hypothetical protein
MTNEFDTVNVICFHRQVNQLLHELFFWLLNCKKGNLMGSLLFLVNIYFKKPGDIQIPQE